MFVIEDRPSRRTAEFPADRIAASTGSALCYGRFVQADPLGYEDGLNMYNYVGGDPINSSDPTGTRAFPNLLAEDGSTYNAPNLSERAGGVSFVGNPFSPSTTVDARRAGSGSLNRSAAVSTGSFFYNSKPGTTSSSHNFTLTDNNDDGEIVVTATKRISDSTKYVPVGGKYYLNPHYNPPVEITLGQAIVGSAVLGAAAAILPEIGPAGDIFGRARLRTEGAGVLNFGNFRLGWSWLRQNEGWAGARNYFGFHGGEPGTEGHWHRNYIPGPK